MDVGGRILHFVGFVVACMDCHREKKGRKLRREGVKGWEYRDGLKRGGRAVLCRGRGLYYGNQLD